MNYHPIENYGIIGDLHTVALVGLDGSIDFMCFPNFDSPSIFASMLDHKKGGRFKIGPANDDRNHKQMYLPDSNILLTRFLCHDGIAQVSDFMAIQDNEGSHALIRRAKGVHGTIPMRLICDPKFDYGRSGHTLKWGDEEVLFIPDNDKISAIRLKTKLPIKEHNGAVVCEFNLTAEESHTIILEEAKPNEKSRFNSPDSEIGAFKDTYNFWQRWVGRSTYEGRWREMVNRSALTLKLLTSKKYGSIVAAPTFGLPEVLGGERNWDYRFTWIRDASFTLYALMRLGYTEEAESFMKWIEDRCEDLNPDGSLQIMYGLDGRKELIEQTLPHFEGYKGSAPVRVGNAAYNQLQLDIYGELMDSIYLYDKYGSPISHNLWKNVVRLVDWVCNNWHRKDEGIWEVRGGKREFLYSKLMCWVALDRAIRLSRKRSLPAPFDYWMRVRDEIYNEIHTRFWHLEQQAFVQHKETDRLDASNLLMPLIRFIGPTDPRWTSTLKAIGKDLVEDSLVYRYRLSHEESDGLSGIEGTFNMCSFWYVECLSRAGDVKKARFLFEKMLGYSNHLGLYSEEIGLDGSHLGNFPQAFTHLSLISAAYNLDQNLSSHHINW